MDENTDIDELIGDLKKEIRAIEENENLKRLSRHFKAESGVMREIRDEIKVLEENIKTTQKEFFEIQNTIGWLTKDLKEYYILLKNKYESQLLKAEGEYEARRTRYFNSEAYKVRWHFWKYEGILKYFLVSIQKSGTKLQNKSRNEL